MLLLHLHRENAIFKALVLELFSYSFPIRAQYAFTSQYLLSGPISVERCLLLLLLLASLSGLNLSINLSLKNVGIPNLMAFYLVILMNITVKTNSNRIILWPGKSANSNWPDNDGFVSM